MHRTFAVALLIALAGCAGGRPAGSSCSASGDCENGLQCLYALGSGCNAQGQCAVPSTDCAGGNQGIVICGCGSETVDFRCIGNATLPQRTATGAACLRDGGREASDAAAD